MEIVITLYILVGLVISEVAYNYVQNYDKYDSIIVSSTRDIKKGWYYAVITPLWFPVLIITFIKAFIKFFN